MCGCNTTPNTNCTSCAPVNNCECTTGYTMNTDCVIYNKERLPFESPSVLDNSSRSLTSVLKAIHNDNLITSEFHTIGDGPFTLNASSFDKLIVLEDIEGVILTNAVVTLPSTLDYAGKVYTFVNKTPVASGQWSFNVPLIVDYDPLTTQTNYNTIVTSPTKILQLTFVQTTPVSWGWVILKN